jgi:glycosyltransferase involved in cell wall biosynthesis
MHPDPIPPFPAKPWLSIVMPVHRGEAWVGAALESVAKQADDGIELLFIDSSPDSASAKVARHYSDRLRINIHAQSPILPWQAKTNFGVGIAGADHICWLHQDDLWLPGRADAVRRWIDDAPQAALHLAPSAIIDATGESLGIWRCPFSSEGKIGRERLFERLLVQNFISAPAPLFRKDAWMRTGGMDEALWYTPDWDIWLKLAQQGAVVHHKQLTTAFRVHGSSQTVTGSRDIGDFEEQLRIVFDRHLPLVGAKRKAVRRAGLASIRLNCALAEVAQGRWRPLLGALAALAALGPTGFWRYMRDSRIIDRLVPRVRAKLTGSF